MKILKKGVLFEDRTVELECHRCGCVVECTVAETQGAEVKCPTSGCNESLAFKLKPRVVPMTLPKNYEESLREVMEGVMPKRRLFFYTR